MSIEELLFYFNKFNCTDAINKCKNIKEGTKIIINKYNNDLPNTYNDMISLPGIGQYAATSLMNYSMRELVGITTDCHVMRISKRIGFVDDNLNDPISIRNELESWLPIHLWKDI